MLPHANDGIFVRGAPGSDIGNAVLDPTLTSGWLHVPLLSLDRSTGAVLRDPHRGNQRMPFARLAPRRRPLQARIRNCAAQAATRSSVWTVCHELDLGSGRQWTANCLNRENHRTRKLNARASEEQRHEAFEIFYVLPRPHGRFLHSFCCCSGTGNEHGHTPARRAAGHLARRARSR